MKKPFLSPRNDAVFKMLFGDAQNTSHLTAFLKSTLSLPDEDYAEVTIIDPHSRRDLPDDKQSILDVKVKTATGKRLNIEIQITHQFDLRERLVFYLAHMVTEQLGKGEEYGKLRRSICILISDHVQITENGVYHNRYRLHDAQTGSEFTDLMEVNTLELPKLPRKADGTVLWDWLKFLDARKEEDLMMLKTRNPEVGQAIGRLMELSEDEAARMIAESREKLQRDILSIKHGARREGREEGLEEGREEMQLAFARKLLKRGRSIEEIMEYTDLSEAEILALRARDNLLLH